jgi:plastocyanin
MVILGTVLFGVAAAACGGTAPAASAAHPKVTVAIKDFIYTPTNLEIAAGTTVTWTNQDTAQHTSTHAATGSIQFNADGTFNLAGSAFNVIENENGGGGSYTFTEPGTYQYFCLWHNAMRGTVVVK